MGSDMLLAAIPLNFTDAARQQHQRWGLTSVEAARPILTARASRFSASRTFGSYPADGHYADTWLNARLDLTRTPTDRVNEITDTIYQQRLTQAKSTATN